MWRKQLRQQASTDINAQWAPFLAWSPSPQAEVMVRSSEFG
jgi:hypothetical protein